MVVHYFEHPKLTKQAVLNLEPHLAACKFSAVAALSSLQLAISTSKEAYFFPQLLCLDQ